MLHLKHLVLFFTLKQIGKNCRQQKKERTKQIGNQLAGSLFQSVQILIFDWFFLDKVCLLYTSMWSWSFCASVKRMILFIKSQVASGPMPPMIPITGFILLPPCQSHP